MLSAIILLDALVLERKDSFSVFLMSSIGFEDDIPSAYVEQYCKVLKNEAETYSNDALAKSHDRQVLL